MLVLSRCDDRLIHGQCMTVITKEYDIKNIIVVDDFTATNTILKTVFQTAVPSDMRANVYTVEESIIEIKNAMKSDERVMILVKSPIIYNQLVEKVENLPKDLNIGPMSKRKNTISATQTAYLTETEVEAIKSLTLKGYHIFFQQIPNEKKIEWEDIKSKFN